MAAKTADQAYRLPSANTAHRVSIIHKSSIIRIPPTLPKNKRMCNYSYLHILTTTKIATFYLFNDHISCTDLDFSEKMPTFANVFCPMGL